MCAFMCGLTPGTKFINCSCLVATSLCVLAVVCPCLPSQQLHKRGICMATMGGCRVTGAHTKQGGRGQQASQKQHGAMHLKLFMLIAVLVGLG